MTMNCASEGTLQRVKDGRGSLAMDEEGKGCEGRNEGRERCTAGFAPIVPGRVPHEGKKASSGQENNQHTTFPKIPLCTM